ncbi:MAG: alpha-glucosidase C-terminal domain-containing protein, partial [Spirochaetales bacterium]|nr:alpha-glucosidase C-terminal domain-containing protein [Spirochaetales bacterium]
PYVYMGEEIGMTNCYFDKIEDYRDLETLNIYKEKMEQGVDETEFMEILKYRSRDNSRTPMQWNDNHEAGFTTGKPWINVIKNYKDINVEKALSNKNSIFYYYKNIIKIRKENLSLIYGTFTEIVDVEPNIFAYYRTLADEKMLVVINMADEFTLFKTDNMDFSKYKRVISNYNDELIYEGLNIKLKPFQSFIYKVQ